MPAYISVEPTRKDRKDGANIIEEPNLFVDVQIGPAIIEPVEKLLESLIEVHEPEVIARHHGDGAASCSYCAAIRKARKMLKAVKGRTL